MRRGFVAGVIGLAGILLALVVAFRASPAAAQWLLGRVQMPAALANVAGFFAVLIVAQLVIGLVARIVLATLRPARRRLRPLATLDHLLGALPGLAQGLAISAVALVALRTIAASSPAGQGIERSALAPLVTGAAAAVAPQLQPQVERVIGDTLQARTRLIEPDETLRITPHQDLQVDAAAEERMLLLLNGERTSRGLRPLAMDNRLRDVARAHSAEMLRLGYFSHDSPVSGSPADRLRRAGLTLLFAGENLAYAPTVDVAHQGLMASPGHRANILEPGYSRVGIGVQNAGLYGSMFTQEFGA
jgi:uncharacterized protein YkwD